MRQPWLLIGKGGLAQMAPEDAVALAAKTGFRETEYGNAFDKRQLDRISFFVPPFMRS